MNFCFVLLILWLEIVKIMAEMPVILVGNPRIKSKENKESILNREWLFNKFYKNMENKNEKITKYDCKTYDGIEVCGCIFNGHKPVNFALPNSDFNNVENYFKVAALTKCGNIYYNYIKQCALANMFEDKKPDTVPKDNLQKKMLVLLDVCASCNNGGIITGIKLTHYEDSYSWIFGGCSEEKEFEDFSISGLSIKLNKGNKVDGNTATFSIPVILYHRICKSVFSTSTASDKYIDMKLHIQYSCGSSSSTRIINLPSIDVTKHKDRVAELRGIWVNLDDGNFKQYLLKNNIYTENNKLNDWSNPNIKCWSNNKKICNLN